MKKLVIFNLQTDPSSPVLGFTLDWIEGFKSHFLVTDVVSTHVGERFSLGKIHILELGGGNARNRILAFLKLCKFAFGLILKKSEYYVFHHMSPRTAVFPGILFKLFGIPQALWYSHNSKPLSLKLAVNIVDDIFTSETNSFPIKSHRTHFVGHGISTSKFTNVNPFDERLNEVLCVGRISPVKNIDLLIKEVGLLQNKPSVILVGPSSEKDYLDELRNIAKRLGVTLEIHEAVNYEKVQGVMKKYKYLYSGTQNSVDKSALEGAISGCFVITTYQGTQDLTGMTTVWDALETSVPMRLHEQIKALEAVDASEVANLRKIVQRESTQKNNLDTTILKISSIMKATK